ncbi:MAG: hypothetical protein H0V41_07600 [Pseudonocardiales bacterium]|nr:hypothetical protein [Pseudonocardiales bacterium]
MMFALVYTNTTYLTNYGTSPTGAAVSRTLMLSLGIVVGAAMALAVVVSAISSDWFGRRSQLPLHRRRCELQPGRHPWWRDAAAGSGTTGSNLR